MTDLTTMMSTTNLSDIETEIKDQLQSIDGHPDSMKQATILYILLKETLEQFEKIKPEKFVEPFEKSLVELQKKVKAEDTHIQVNMKLLESMKPLPDFLWQIETEITPILKECDCKLARIKEAIKDLPVEEIAKLKKSKR